MGLSDWITSRSRPGVDVPFGPTYGAVGSGRTDGSGAPIVEFSEEMREKLYGNPALGAPGQLYRSQPSVRTCVNFLAFNIAQLKLKTRRQVDDQQVDARDHELARVLSRPNPRTTPFELWRGTVGDRVLYDDAFWLKRFGRVRGSDKFVYRIPAWAVTPKGGDWFTGPEYYQVSTGRSSRQFTPAEIVHFAGYNPADPRWGTSLMHALRAVLLEDAAASEHRRHFWQNAARIDGVIERPAPSSEKNGTPKWTPEQRRRFLTAWRNAHSGRNNAGKAALLEDGMTWNSASFSPKDAEFIEGREFTLDTVATALHIPLAVLSRKATATFASMKEFRTILYVDTLGPWNTGFEQVVNAQMIPDFDDVEGLFVEFNIEEKLQGDFEAQLTSLRQGSQVPYLSVNDNRKFIGLPPVDDPRYDMPARPINMLYGDEERPPAPATPPRPDRDEEDRPDEDDETRLQLAAANGHAEIDPSVLAEMDVLEADLTALEEMKR